MIISILQKVFLKRDTYYSLIIAILIVIVLLMRSCGPSTNCPDGGKPIVVTKIDTVFVTKEIPKTVYVPGVTVTIPGPTTYKDIDTLAILQDFYSKRIYEDTIKLDTFGYVLVKDTISQNKIISRETQGEYIFPTITKTTTITIPPKPKNQVYIGFDIMGSIKQPINYFGPSIMYKNKMDKVTEIGIGYDPYDNQAVGKFGMKWKIRLKK